MFMMISNLKGAVSPLFVLKDKLPYEVNIKP
jgi:hypothetical protein